MPRWILWCCCIRQYNVLSLSTRGVLPNINRKSWYFNLSFCNNSGWFIWELVVAAIRNCYSQSQFPNHITQNKEATILRDVRGKWAQNSIKSEAHSLWCALFAKNFWKNRSRAWIGATSKLVQTQYKSVQVWKDILVTFYWGGSSKCLGPLCNVRHSRYTLQRLPIYDSRETVVTGCGWLRNYRDRYR